MRVTAALDRWCDDASAQRAARAATVDCARACHALPALVAFRRALAGAGDDPAAVEAAAVALLAEDGWAGELVGLMARAAADEPFFDPPFLPIDNGLHQGLILHDDARVVVALGLGSLEALAAKKARAGPASVTFSGYRTHLRFLKAGGATLGLYRIDGDRARRVGRRAIADGETLAIDGRTTGWTVDHASGDLVILQATVKTGRADLAREYDADSGALVALATNDEAASRMQMLISLLAATGLPEAQAAIAGCLGDAHAFVRWHAMRELAALAPDAALPPLAAMAANDPEPEIRDAARATLSLLCPA